MQVFSFIAEGKRSLLGRTVVLMFIALLIFAGVSPARAELAALVMDASTGRILHESNADVSRYPASLTKMMTLYLLFESLDDGLLRLDDRLPISAHAASQPPTKIGLKPGQNISVENAILALVTKSANDIAAAIAETLGGSEPQFAWMMTRKAHELGMVHTTFMNASGLPDPSQMTTARDMGILALALLHDFPHYYPYFSTERFYYGGAVHPNHNRLLGVYQGLDGIKTGYTQAAGFNLVASAHRDGRRLIGVVLGARSPVNRSVIMTGLLDQAFAGQPVIEVRDTVPAVPVLASAGRRTVVAATRAPAQRAVATRTVSRSGSQAARRTAVQPTSVAARTPSSRSLAAAPTRSASRSVQSARPAKLAMASPKPSTKVTTTARPASSVAVTTRKAKPQVASDAKPKGKATARRGQATNGRGKRVLTAAR